MSALGPACFDDDGRDEDGNEHDGDSDDGMIYQIFRFSMSMMLIMKKETKVMMMSLKMALYTTVDTQLNDVNDADDDEGK